MVMDRPGSGVKVLTILWYALAWHLTAAGTVWVCVSNIAPLAPPP